MSGNSFGHLFRFTTFGESHGPAIGCVVDGTPPNIPLTEEAIQVWLDKRKPGQSRFTTQRKEADKVELLSGVFDGKTTGTPISLLIRNTDARSKDYDEIKHLYRPGHADYTYQMKYGIRNWKGGGRACAAARECDASGGPTQVGFGGARGGYGPQSPPAGRGEGGGIYPLRARCSS